MPYGEGIKKRARWTSETSVKICVAYKISDSEHTSLTLQLWDLYKSGRFFLPFLSVRDFFRYL